MTEPASDELIAEIEAFLSAGWDALTGGCAAALIARIRQQEEQIKRMDEALARAETFIINGTELGFIRMPDADVPDPAHETLPVIRAARAARKEPT